MRRRHCPGAPAAPNLINGSTMVVFDMSGPLSAHSGAPMTPVHTHNVSGSPLAGFSVPFHPLPGCLLISLTVCAVWLSTHLLALLMSQLSTFRQACVHGTPCAVQCFHQLSHLPLSLRSGQNSLQIPHTGGMAHINHHHVSVGRF